MNQRQRTISIFRDAHRAVLKPKGFALRKLWSTRRRCELLDDVHVDLVPYASDDHYPVEVRFGVSLPAGKEPADLSWGVVGTIPDETGSVHLLVHKYTDSELLDVLTSGLEESVLPFIETFATPADLVEFFSGSWADPPGLSLFPMSVGLRSKWLAYFAEAAGQPGVAQDARAALAAASEPAWVPDYLVEIDERVRRYRAAAAADASQSAGS